MCDDEYVKAVNLLIDVGYTTIGHLASISESPEVIADIARAIERVETTRETRGE